MKKLSFEEMENVRGGNFDCLYASMDAMFAFSDFARDPSPWNAAKFAFASIKVELTC